MTHILIWDHPTRTRIETTYASQLMPNEEQAYAWTDWAEKAHVTKSKQVSGGEE